NALDHFLKMEETIAEIKRVLKPNGYFLFLIGSGFDAERDKHASTYWKDDKDVLNYLIDKHGFQKVAHADVTSTEWFSYYAVMQYVES
ncbi:unnamed protein product, partial [marine sediment metagenome]